MMFYLQLFLIKALDTAFSSSKTLLNTRGKYFASGVCNAISYFLFAFGMKSICNDNGIVGILVMTLAVFLGQFLTGQVMDKFDKDKIWKIHFTSRSMDQGKEIRERLEGLGIAFTTTKQYNKDGRKILVFSCFAKTKEETSLLKSIAKENSLVYSAIELKSVMLD